MTPIEQYHENIANTLIKQFQKRGMEGYYCPTGEEAVEKALCLLSPGCSVGWGGSTTLTELGMFDRLKAGDYVVYDRAGDPPAPHSLICPADSFFMSSNAITLEGELVNIDMSGNRVANLIHGPKNVIIMAGLNKLATDVPSAIDRVRNCATPPNCNRLGKNTPCSVTGKCADCLGPDCLCANIVITRKSVPDGRIKVILIGESYGY